MSDIFSGDIYNRCNWNADTRHLHLLYQMAFSSTVPAASAHTS